METKQNFTLKPVILSGKKLFIIEEKGKALSIPLKGKALDKRCEYLAKIRLCA